MKVNAPDLDWLKSRTILDKNGCWTWQGSQNKDGYGKVSIAGHDWRAHRLAWVITGHLLGYGECVLHHCDNPPCCNPAHLFVGTQADNRQDCVEKGRTAKGDNNGARLHPNMISRGEGQGLSKLTASNVREIRSTDTSVAGTRRKLALKFGVSLATIQQVTSGKTWNHI